MEVVREPRLLHALRFLAGPFISEADLAVIAETRLSARALELPRRRRADRRLACSPASTGAASPGCRADGCRAREERDAAALATASLMATEQVRTWRRNAVKSLQEDSVAEALRGAGFREVPTRKAIRTLEDAPGRGEFCREIDLRRAQGRRAGGPPGPAPHAHRVQGVELGHQLDQAGAQRRRRQGHHLARRVRPHQVVPTAVLAGVFKPATLESAQARGLTLFWAHRLDDLIAWIRRTGR